MRLSTRIGSVGLIAVLAGTNACSTPPPDLSVLPPTAIAAISFGGMIIGGKAGRVVTVVIDAVGAEVGRFTGRRDDRGGAVAVPGTLITTTGTDAITVDGTRKSVTPFEMTATSWGEAATTDRAVTWWARDTSRYVLSRPGASPVVGELPTAIVAAGFCGDKAFALAGDWRTNHSSISSGVGLYELRGNPRRIGDAEFAEFAEFPDNRLVCDADGVTLHAIGRSSRGARGGRATLHSYNSRDARRTVRTVDIPEAANRLFGLTAIGDRLFRLDSTHKVWSVPMRGGTVARKVWQGRQNDPRYLMVASGDRAVEVRHLAPPTYSEFDLATGRRLVGPLPLPWLPGVIADDVWVLGATAIPRPAKP
ncbi:hypothetical protein [Gordonia malaquae]|uniref:hypothetical protein n=1 Tax=Gordonia malaquae TaxID=410332 RepID=UPI0030FF0266